MKRQVQRVALALIAGAVAGACGASTPPGEVSAISMDSGADVLVGKMDAARGTGSGEAGRTGVGSGEAGGSDAGSGEDDSGISPVDGGMDAGDGGGSEPDSGVSPPTDAGGSHDAGGSMDSSRSEDSGAVDSGQTDSGSTDSGRGDTGSTDAGPPDAHTTDSGSSDSGSDTGATDSAAPPRDGGTTTIPCGAATCDNATQQCCAGLEGEECIAKGGTCTGIPITCTSPENCPSDDVCCASATGGGTLDGLSATCSATCDGYELCETDTDCPAGDACEPVLDGISICGGGLGGFP